VHISPRRVIGAVATLLIAGSVVAAPTATSKEGFALERIAGQNRYETAAAIAAEAFPDGSDVAVLASGVAFPDALAGSFLAGRFGNGAPVLLTTKDALPDATKTALDDLGVETVYVLGGTGAVSEAVLTALGERTVERIAGTNRYETAAAIATSTPDGAAAPGSVGAEKVVIVASGEKFADALAAGPLAFAGNLPIVLTQASELPTATADAIEEVGATTAWLVGGTAAIGAEVAEEIEAAGVDTVRIAGANRYATAVAVAERGRADLGLTTSAVDLASGEDFPDALAAGPASGVATRPLLLTARAELSDETEEHLIDLSPTLTSGRVFGGTAAVSDTAVSQANSAGSSGEALGVSRLVAIRPSENEYDYVTEGDDEIVTIAYEDADDFTVDGRDAAVDGFESQASAGDIIEVDSVVDPDEHDLTNVSAASFTSGVVGNVDLADKQLDIVEPVSGAAFRRNITWSETNTFRVDAGASDLAGFEADVNEGDSIEIAGASLLLANEVTTGPAREVEISDPDPSDGEVGNEARFKIQGLGDIPAAGSDGGLDPETNDDKYRADGAPGASGQTYEVNGAQGDYDAFAGALTNGDTVSYERVDGVEAFTLTDEAQTSVEGTAVDDLDDTGDSSDTPPLGEPPATDGGSFSVVDADGEVVEVTYVHDGQFIVDGQVSTEAAFEREYSAGDEVSFRAGDAAADQLLELTNANLAGTTADVNTTDDDRPDVAEQGSDPANSYDVVLDAVVLETVLYDSTDDQFFINGSRYSLTCFEQVLTDGRAITRVAGDDPDTTTAWQHRITVPAASIPNTCTPIA
jgi:putative cell wall-binding protein